MEALVFVSMDFWGFYRELRYFHKMRSLVLISIFFTTVLGGTLCPPRENIYPCNCINIQISKRMMNTIVNCHHLKNTDSLSAILPAIRNIQIDQFHLYNSFWEAHKLEVTEKMGVMPMDWLSLLKAKEIEIYDTALGSCFACQSKMTCKNTVTNRFAAMNSSTSEKFCALCDTGKGNAYPWIGCMSRLKQFHYSHGRLQSIGADMFPLEMRELLVLNLTHNEITSVRQGAFSKLKRLTTLDLSHNQIDYFFFNTTASSLELLDLSWNRLKDIDSNLFIQLTSLRQLMLASNDITELKEANWNKSPPSLRFIDLSENPIHCDCNIRWLNGTFHVSTVIEGTCATPEDYEDSAIRKASRMLIQRCDEDGNIGTRKKSSYTSPISLL
ncbi:uncharacterized protein CEXT_15961 [Caerostris extrusa]|uniref:Uncharacterized protein n=1 Tax=Caerostris extrusa TaxID=172846 RepID=A0AAV4UCP3_CAEEX|nr:uncharacterized protein CEXT_15961 [Caerostris extrusa]